MEPELAEDGCNWHTYGSWVLKALSEDDLMGYLEGSETRPTRNGKLSRPGKPLTTCGINGLPWPTNTSSSAYPTLENRYGQIPRPEIQKTLDEAVQQHDLSSKQDVTDGSDDSLDSPSDCTETQTGHMKPEPEVADVQQLEDHLLVVEAGAVDSIQPDERANALEAPRSSSKSLEPKGDTTRLAGGHSIESGLLPSDPPGTHAKLPNPQVESSTLRSEPEVTGSMLKDPSKESERSSQLRETERPEPHRDRTSEGKFRIYEGRFTSDTPPNEAWGMGVHRPTQVGLGDSTDVEAKATKLEIRPVSAKMAGMQDTIPVPPEPPPNAPTRTPSTFVDPHRYGRPTSRAERVSNKCTRRNACRARAVFVRPLTFLLAPSRRSRYPAGGLWMTKIGCRKVRYAKRVEMRGYTHRGSHTSVSPPHEVLQCLWNISNTFWLQWVPPVSMLNDTGWPTNLPVPSKPARIDFAHTPGTLREPHRRGRIKTRSKNVSTVKTRGAKASILPIPTSPPCDISQHLWNVANTYWRHGIPPEHTRSVDKPLLFETAASQQRHKAEDEHTANGFPKWKLQQRGASNTTKHRPYSHGLEALLAEACTLVYWIYY